MAIEFTATSSVPLLGAGSYQELYSNVVLSKDNTAEAMVLNKILMKNVTFRKAIHEKVKNFHPNLYAVLMKEPMLDKLTDDESVFIDKLQEAMGFKMKVSDALVTNDISSASADYTAEPPPASPADEANLEPSGQNVNTNRTRLIAAFRTTCAILKRGYQRIKPFVGAGIKGAYGGLKRAPAILTPIAGFVGYFPSSPFMPLAVGAAAVGACLYTRSYTQDSTATNYLHMGLVGGGEMFVAAMMGATVASWMQNTHKRSAVKTVRQALIFSGLMLAIPLVLGKSPDPFVSIPYKVLTAFGVKPPSPDAIQTTYQQATASSFSSTIIQPGDRVSIEMSAIGFTYGADQKGNPNQLDRTPVPQGDSFCAIGTNGDFFKAITPDGSTVFVRKYMAMAGGDACDEVQAPLPPVGKQGAIVPPRNNIG